MLGDKEAIATISVKDLAVARKFYEGVLGLRLQHAKGEEATTSRTGKAASRVYRSNFAGKPKATALHFHVGPDIDRLVKGLTERGVSFEHSDMPGLTRQGALHVSGDTKIAWFKDPDGNILCLMNG